jgi:integrase
MEHIKETIKKNRPHIAESSVKTYSSIVSNLYKYITKEKDVGDAVGFFNKHSKDVINYLKNTEPSTRKTKLAALVVLCEKQPCVEVYRKQMLDDAHKYNDREKDQEKTETQRENWIEQDELKKIYDELDKDTRPLLSKATLKPSEFQRLQNFVILSLYVLQPPRRLQDYTEMKLKNIDEKTDNYINKTKFVFNKYKTAKFSGKEEITINPKLKFILDKWKKLNPYDYLLVGSTEKKFSSSQLQQRLNSILGKKASVNILRHSFLSDKYKDINIRDMEETAKAMGHSKNQAMLYVKHD